MDITGAYRRRGKTPLEEIKHTHIDQYEIIHCMSDGGNVLIGTDLFPMTTGGLYLINTVNFHMTNPDDKDKYTRNVVKFTSSAMRSLLTDLGAVNMRDFLFSDQPGYYFPLDAISSGFADEQIKTICETDDISGIGKATALMRLIDFVYCLHSGKNPTDQTSARQEIPASVLRVIDSRYKEHLTLDDIAEAISVSKYHMCRTFRRAAGITVTQYLVSYRLAEAKKMLAETNIQVADIAVNCGFDTSSHFCIVFRRNEGMTPNEFRRNTRIDRTTE